MSFNNSYNDLFLQRTGDLYKYIGPCALRITAYRNPSFLKTFLRVHFILALSRVTKETRAIMLHDQTKCAKMCRDGASGCKVIECCQPRRGTRCHVDSLSFLFRFNRMPGRSPFDVRQSPVLCEVLWEFIFLLPFILSLKTFLVVLLLDYL